MMISKGCNIVEVLKSVTFRFKIVRHSTRDDSFLIFSFFFYLFFFLSFFIYVYIYKSRYTIKYKTIIDIVRGRFNKNEV